MISGACVTAMSEEVFLLQGDDCQEVTQKIMTNMANGLTDKIKD